MKNINTTPGIGTDPNFLNGDLVDSQTLLNTTILQDIVQFFQKLRSKANVTENGLFDNEANGYQTVEALDKRNHKIRAKSFLFDGDADFPISIGNTFDFVYPYSFNFNYGRFSGIFTFKINGVLTVVELVGISNTFNLATGVILYESGSYRISAFPTKIVVSNYSGAGVLSDMRISLLIQGQTT